MPRNSKKRRFPSGIKVTAENVVDFLFYAAKISEPIRSALVKALVSPGTWFPALPKIPDRDLVTAIRATGLASAYSNYRTPQHDTWLKMREVLVAVLRLQLHNRPPLSVKDIGVAIRVIKLTASYYKLDTTILESDFQQLERDHDVLKKLRMEIIQKGIVPEVRTNMLVEARKEFQGKGARQPRRGRRFSEQDQRILAAIMLLHCCRATKEEAREQVADSLANYERQLQADSLRALETRYRKTCNPTTLGALCGPEKCRQLGFEPNAVVSRATGRPDAFIPPEKLPGFWLQQLGQFLLDPRVRHDPPDFMAHILSQRLEAAWEGCRVAFASTVAR